MERVLMVDDDRELCEMMAHYLAGEGFEVTGVHAGDEGVEAALSGEYSLVLLDVMLPPFNGFEVLRRIRGAGVGAARVPVLMLTARGDALDRIVGLEVGADDYLPKPFNERELVARMRAILRRASAPETAPAQPPQAPGQAPLKVGDVELDLGARVARCNGSEVTLTALEFDLLALLLQKAGQVVGREEIARQVFERPLLAFDRATDTHMHHLRRKLGSHPSGGDRIKTVRSVGYIYTRPTSEG